MKGDLKEFGNVYEEPGSPPNRSIIRGPFESKHGATVPDTAIKRFKDYLLSDPLNNSVPEKYWKISLGNYIKNNLFIIEHEKKRVKTSKNKKSSGSQSFDFFNRAGGSDSNMIVVRPRIEIDGFAVVGDIETAVKTSGSGGASNYKLGENGEFSGYMIEYDTISGDSKKSSDQFDQEGLLDDMKFHIEQLQELQYDHSNIDDILSKNWLFFKLHTLYYNEVIVNNTMTDSGITFRIDQPPQSPKNSAPQDLIIFEHWKTRSDEKISENKEISPNTEVLKEKNIEYGFGKTSRPIPANYVFQNHILIYEKNGKTHGDKNPRIISGLNYTFSSDPGQPNEGGKTQGMVTMRAQFECMVPARGSTIYQLDSTQLQPDYEIDSTVSTTLPVICDKRITYYDNNHGTANQVVIDYNKYVSKEFPDG